MKSFRIKSSSNRHPIPIFIHCHFGVAITAQGGEFPTGEGAPGLVGRDCHPRGQHGQPPELRGEGFAPAARQAGGEDGHLGGSQQAARGPGPDLSQACNLLQTPCRTKYFTCQNGL